MSDRAELNKDSYDDIDASIRAVYGGLQPDEIHEHAGVILQDPNGKYYYTKPITSSKHDAFEVHAGLQKGWKLAGIYHTHPGKDKDGQVFSPDDLNVAAQLKVPSFVRFADGSIRQYQAGKTPTQQWAQPGTHMTSKVARGEDLPPELTAQLAQTDPPPHPEVQKQLMAEVQNADHVDSEGSQRSQ